MMAKLVITTMLMLGVDYFISVSNGLESETNELAAPYLEMDYISKHNGYSIYVIHANDTQYSPELIQRLITDCKAENGLNHVECGVDVLYSDFGWRLRLHAGLSYRFRVQAKGIIKGQRSPWTVLNITVAPEKPKLTFTEVSHDNGYRLYTMITQSQDFHYSSLNISCKVQKAALELLTEEVDCGISEINRDNRMLNLKSGIEYNLTAQAYNLGEMSESLIRIFQPATFPPTNIEVIHLLAPHEKSVLIKWTEVPNQFINSTIITCTPSCPEREYYAPSHNNSMILTGLQGESKYRFQLRTSSFINQRLSEPSEWFDIILCDDGVWAKGTNCVPDASVDVSTVIFGVVASLVLLAGIAIATKMVNNSKKRKSETQGYISNTAGMKPQKQPSVRVTHGSRLQGSKNTRRHSQRQAIVHQSVV